MAHKPPTDTVPSFIKYYTKISASYISKYKKIFFASEFLQLEVYRRVVFWFADDSITKSAFSLQISNWLIAEVLAGKINKEKTRLYSFMPEINNLKNKIYKQALFQKIKILTRFSDGDKAKEIIISDNNKNQIRLSQFRDKVIYIDLWATWCGPCLQEISFLDTLRQRYKADPNIVFISLSIDENEELWKRFLLKRNVSGNQFITSRGELKEYHVIAIPRVIIIDKNFIIAAMNGLLPSSENAITLLNNLLKI